MQNLENQKDGFVGPEFFNGWRSEDVSDSFWSNFSQYKKTKDTDSWDMVHAAMNWAEKNDRKLYKKIRRAWDHYDYGEGFYDYSGHTQKVETMRLVLGVATIGAIIIISCALSKIL